MYIYIACYSPTLNFCYLPIPPYGRKRQLYHWYSCRRKSPVPDTSPAGSYHNLWAHGTETPHSCSAVPWF